MGCRAAVLLATALVAACSSVPAGYHDDLARWHAAADVGGAGGPDGAEGHGAPDTAGTPRVAPLGAHATLDDLLSHARRHNAGLVAARQHWRAALEQVPQAASLPDPRLTLGWFVDEIETRAGPMDWRLGLSQAFPWFGRLDLAGERALAAAEVARAELDDLALEVEREVRDAWAELGWLERAIGITDAHLGLLSNWEEVARTRYSAGSGGDADVIRAQVELGRLDDRLATLRDMRRPLRARLNALLDRPVGAPLPDPTGEPGTDGPGADHEAAPDVTSEALQDLLVGLSRSSPRLRALAAAVEAAERGVDLADLESYPDVTLGAEYTGIGSAKIPGQSDSGDDALALTVGLELPLRRGRIEAGVRQAEAGLRAARARLTEAHNRLSAELELALYQWRDARRRVALHRDALVIKGRQSVQSVTVAYQADTAGFLDLIDAERALLEFELALARARADAAQSRARVERLSGTRLSPVGAAPADETDPMTRPETPRGGH